VRNDDETLLGFVVELRHSIFKNPIADALRITEKVNAHGRAICGIYPRDVADELLEAARERSRDTGHPLLMTSEAVAGSSEDFGAHRVWLKGVVAREITGNLPEVTRREQFNHAYEALGWYLRHSPGSSRATYARMFKWPSKGCSRVSPIRFFSIHEQQRYETLTFAGLDQGWPRRPDDRAGAV
jgi:ATP-dependent Clp protease adaptor protein ClpS